MATRAGLSAYQILQVPKDASKKSIKKAYMQLAKKYHPDMITGQ